MKKVLYVTTVSRTINAFLIPHIEYLVKQGYEVQVASNIDVALSKEIDEIGVKHTIINFSRNPFSLKNRKAYKEIIRLQEKSHFDIVHVHTPVASFITRMALRKENIRMIYTAHGFHFYKGAPIINWIIFYQIEKISAKWTDIMVTINREDLKAAKTFKLRNNGQVYLMPGVGIEESKYNMENFNKVKYRETLGINKNDFVILVLAELNKNKNHIQMIRSMGLLSEKYPDIKVVFAGDGPLQYKLMEKVKNLKLESNVIFLGYRSDVCQLLYSCDCLGLFSHREGLGKCLMEGMIAGKPLLATNTRGPRELISHGENGFLVKIGDYKQLARYIEELYKDKKLQESYGEASKRKIKAYTMDKVLDTINNFY